MLYMYKSDGCFSNRISVSRDEDQSTMGHHTSYDARGSQRGTVNATQCGVSRDEDQSTKWHQTSYDVRGSQRWTVNATQGGDGQTLGRQQSEWAWVTEAMQIGGIWVLMNLVGMHWVAERLKGPHRISTSITIAIGLILVSLPEVLAGDDLGRASQEEGIHKIMVAGIVRMIEPIGRRAVEAVRPDADPPRVAPTPTVMKGAFGRASEATDFIPGSPLVGPATPVGSGAIVSPLPTSRVPPIPEGFRTKLKRRPWPICKR